MPLGHPTVSLDVSLWNSSHIVSQFTEERSTITVTCIAWQAETFALLYEGGFSSEKPKRSITIPAALFVKMEPQQQTALTSIEV
jgi:hypothetical protein